MNEIEKKVDQLFADHEAVVPRRRKHWLLRSVGVGGGGLAVWKLLLIAVVSGALISTIVGEFLVTQTTLIPFSGREAYDLFIDGVAVGADDYLMPSDNFSDGGLVWGEIEVFNHTFMSPEFNGDFDLYWNYSWQTWLYPTPIPEAEFYGYSFYITDELDNPITQVSVMNGETRTLKFWHVVDNHMAVTSGPIPYAHVINVVEYVEPPTAIDDHYTIPVANTQTKAPLENDLGEPLDIVSLGTIPYGITATLNADDTVTIYVGTTGSFQFTYEVNTGAPLFKSDTGTVYVN